MSLFRIVLIVAIIIFTVKTLKNASKNRKDKALVLKCFRAGNVVCAGHKGAGKDLLFWWVASTREKDGEPHAGNIRYTAKTRVKPIKDYSLRHNTIENFISGDFNKEDKTFREKEDYYISDVGTSLPGWCHNQLEKKYPTFPIVYALSRQLADFNIHCNEQEFGRVWDKLRGQAQTYIWVEKSKVAFGRAKLTGVVYSRYQTAIDAIQPFYVRTNVLGIKNKQDLQYAQQFNAKYGLVKRFTISFKIGKGKNMYDTRDFHKKLYGYPAPDLTKKQKKALKTAQENKKKYVF